MRARDDAAVYTSMVWDTVACSCGVLTCSSAEAMQIGPKRKSFPLQRATLSRRSAPSTHVDDAPAVRCKAPQKVQECIRGGALAPIG